jgi:DNA topoisomerase I
VRASDPDRVISSGSTRSGRRAMAAVNDGPGSVRSACVRSLRALTPTSCSGKRPPFPRAGRRVPDCMARRGGWRRRRRRSHFLYEDAHGDRVRDEAALERIESLAIPPAWKDVWISPNPRAKLQATGEDAAGRRQYLYHPDFRAAQELKKFDRLVGFGDRLPDLRRQMVGHLELEPYERDWTSAVALSFVNRAWFRAGSERRRSNVRTYGVTTLCKRHATVRGDRVTFRFRGKGRVLVRSTVADTTLADAVRALLDFPGGSRLFRYERDGEAALLTAPILNEYVSEHMGDGFTTKDFRTWGGTLTAALALAKHEFPASRSEERRILAAVMRRVGEELGNTAAVARASYVSPAVIEQWREGRVLEARSSRNGTFIVDSRRRGLWPEEKELLTLLRSWRAKKAARAA